MRGDDMRQSGWRAPDTRPAAHSAGRPARGAAGMIGGRGALAALATLVTIALLTACLYAAVVPVLTRVLATAPSAATGPVTAARGPTSAVPPGTAAQEGTATPASADWYAFTVGGVFRVDVPGVIGSSHGYFINDFSGQGVDLAYIAAPISTPLQRLEAQTEVTILYSTKITTLNICPQGGTPVQIGSGDGQVPAWERDEGQGVAVNLVLNGTAIEISLTNRADAEPALPRFSEIWRHMLASVAPLPAQTPPTTQPCG